MTDITQKVADCRELYLKYEGRRHERIEREMRALGHEDFHRRSLYRRFERGRCVPGWIETYGFDSLLKLQAARDSGEAASERGQPARNAGSSGVTAVADSNVEETRAPSGRSGGHAGRLPAFRQSSAADFAAFIAWLKRVSPNMKWEFRHQVYLYKYLKRVTDGTCKRLMIFMPPRHGKSELVTVRYAAWRLKQDPSMNVIIGSYNQKLANRFSRKIKRVLTEDALSEPPAIAGGLSQASTQHQVTDSTRCEFRPGAVSSEARTPNLQPPATAGGSDRIFPFTSSRPANTEAEWETSLGGGLRAVGVGAGVTGFGASLIIVDDPVKSRAEAESETYRTRVWEWFNDDLYTRLEPDGAIILIQTRWHEDDLAGRLLREMADGGERWDVVDLPALSEPPASAGGQFGTLDGPSGATNWPHAYAGGSDPLGRAPGEALWPERFDINKLEKIRRKLGSYSFAALYQQRPTPAEGGLFKRAWFKSIVPAPPPGLKWKRAWDLAVTASATSDYTASVRTAYDKSGNLYIDSAFRRRIEYPEQRRQILGRIALEADTTEHGVEATANGIAIVQDLIREPRTRGRALRAIHVKDPKTARTLPLVTLAEQGRVILIRGPWNTDFIDEACAFPLGSHDDLIDAATLSLRMHRQQAGKLWTF